MGEVLKQLRLGQLLDAAVKLGPDAPQGARVGFDGLRLQTLEPKVLQMRLVLALEALLTGC